MWYSGGRALGEAPGDMTRRDGRQTCIRGQNTIPASVVLEITKRISGWSASAR